MTTETPIWKLPLFTDTDMFDPIQAPLNLISVDLERAMDALIARATPSGTVIMGGWAVAPAGFLMCQGQPVLRSDYATLFTAIGTAYGAGNGGTTFNVPNLQGRVPVGLSSSDTEFDVLGETGGEKKHTITIPEMASHTHASYPLWAAGAGGGAANVISGYPVTGAGQYTVEVSATGGGLGHNNIQPYVTVNYAIKV